MKAEKKPSPQAFPGIDENTGTYNYGMTLRDYFANSVDGRDIVNRLKYEELKALTNYENVEYDLPFRLELEAKVQYMKADAMLKAREL